MRRPVSRRSRRTHPNKKIPADFFLMVASWCERNDQHPAEGWLALVLDGTLSVGELRTAILEDRAPKES